MLEPTSNDNFADSISPLREGIFKIIPFVAYLQKSSSRFSFSLTTRVFPRHAAKDGMKNNFWTPSSEGLPLHFKNRLVHP